MWRGRLIAYRLQRHGGARIEERQCLVEAGGREESALGVETHRPHGTGVAPLAEEGVGRGVIEAHAPLLEAARHLGPDREQPAGGGGEGLLG